MKIAGTEAPAPGYATSKPLIEPIRSMLKELGAQDAAVQLQELSIRYLNDAVTSSSLSAAEFLKPLFRRNGIPQGTHSFNELRSVATISYIVMTYAALEKMLRGVGRDYRHRHSEVGARWKNKNGAGETLSPFQELCANLPKEQRAILNKCPEAKLFEYYRLVRVSLTHRTQQTIDKAVRDFEKFSPADLMHFKGSYTLEAPNPPERLTFDDFLLFTRATKYFARLVNECCG